MLQKLKEIFVKLRISNVRKRAKLAKLPHLGFSILDQGRIGVKMGDDYLNHYFYIEGWKKQEFIEFVKYLNDGTICK